MITLGKEHFDGHAAIFPQSIRSVKTSIPSVTNVVQAGSNLEMPVTDQTQTASTDVRRGR